MSEAFDSIMQGLNEALDYAKGKDVGARVHVIEFSDAKAIREGLGLSQQEFAKAYRIPLATLKGWEQGRRHPDATASAYLSVIAGMPEAAREVLRAA
ncbi:MAG TPA: NadS family protein [Sphingomonadaceae bacterium]